MPRKRVFQVAGGLSQIVVTTLSSAPGCERVIVTLQRERLDTAVLRKGGVAGIVRFWLDVALKERIVVLGRRVGGRVKVEGWQKGSGVGSGSE